MARTFDSIIASMTSYVLANLPGQDTRIGTVLREAFLGPVAEILVDVYAQADATTANQTISAPNNITTAAMDGSASNYGLSRSAGVPASGVVNFYRFQAPAFPISIPINTIVSASGSGSSITFKTLASYSLSSLSPQDPVTGAFFVSASVQATVSGAAGNIASGAITNFSLPGIDQIINPNAMAGGQDTQTNDQLAALIKARAQGNMGTLGGYRSLVLQNFALNDMAIVAPTDPEATRVQFGGELDIIIKDSNVIGSQETPFSNTTVFHPLFLPLVSVTSITGLADAPSSITLAGPLVTSNTISVSVNGYTVSVTYATSSNATMTAFAAAIAARPGVVSAVFSGSTITVSTSYTILTSLTISGGVSQTTGTIAPGIPSAATLVPTTDYSVILDTFSPLGRSETEKSVVNFHLTSFLPFNGSVFTILYNNSQDVRTIQTFVDDPTNQILGSDVMIKLAVSTPVNVTANIYIIPGYDPTAVQNGAIAAVAGLFSSLLLGVDVSESEVISAIASVPGLHYVDVSTFLLALASAPLIPLQDILAGKQEYLILGALSVNVAG